MFESIDFRSCEILYHETDNYKKEDLLQLACKNGHIIDVGYYGNGINYCIYVIENNDWEHPCYKITREQMKHLEIYLQKVIDFETASFTESSQDTLNQITDIIDHWSVFNGSFDDVVYLLKRLWAMGLSQHEVANYIEVYGCRYYDSDDQSRWDLVCDLLDRVTGWCSPDLHIWRDESE